MVSIKTIPALIIMTFLCLPIAGCGDSNDKEAPSRIETLENEVADLTGKLDETQRKIEMIENQYQQLASRYANLGEWADHMVTGFGTGIWYIQDTVYPVFVKSMKTDRVEDIIEELNLRFKEDRLPEVLYLDQEGSTVVVGVSDDAQLTRKMGSFGAMSYMNAVVFSLASLKSVTCVQFKFEEGDHASPGTYCRRLAFRE